MQSRLVGATELESCLTEWLAAAEGDQLQVCRWEETETCLVLRAKKGEAEPETESESGADRAAVGRNELVAHVLARLPQADHYSVALSSGDLCIGPPVWDGIVDVDLVGHKQRSVALHRSNTCVLKVFVKLARETGIAAAEWVLTYGVVSADGREVSRAPSVLAEATFPIGSNEQYVVAKASVQLPGPGDYVLVVEVAESEIPAFRLPFSAAEEGTAVAQY